MVEVYALEPTAASAKATPVSYARAGSPSVENLEPKENAAKTHRTGYRRVRVGMSDLHSSIKDGCLM